MTQSTIHTATLDAAGALLPPISRQLDPGMRYTLMARTATTYVPLGTIDVVPIGGTVTEYFTLINALPAGTTSIILSAVTLTSAPSGYTFATSPAAWGPNTPPSSSATTFVNTRSNVGLAWGFTKDASGWRGTASWYHYVGRNIAMTSGSSITLFNNTFHAQLTYRAINIASGNQAPLL